MQKQQTNITDYFKNNKTTETKTVSIKNGFREIIKGNDITKKKLIHVNEDSNKKLDLNPKVEQIELKSKIIKTDDLIAKRVEPNKEKYILTPKKDEICFSRDKINDNKSNTFRIIEEYDYKNRNLPETYEKLLESCFEHNINFPFKLFVLKNCEFSDLPIFYAFLRGKWYNTEGNVSNKIEIIGKFDLCYNIIVLSHELKNFLILEPDIVLYPTLILDSYKCYRKGILKLNFSGRDSPNMALTIGTLVHLIFEHCFRLSRSCKIDHGKIMEFYNSFKLNFIEDLYLMDKNEADLDQEFLKLSYDIANFYEEFINGSKPYLKSEKGKEQLKILKVMEAECMINMPHLGVKGQVDAIFYCEITNEKGEIRNSFIPFELKTGTEYFLHFYQGFLYCILLTHKYHQNLELNCIFYYLQQKKILLKSGNEHEVTDLIIKRNALAKAIYQYENNKNEDIIDLPQMLEKSPFECNRCPYNEICSVVDLSYKDGNDIEECEKKFEIYDTIKEKITEKDKSYIKKWFKLLELEKNYEKKSNNIFDNSEYFVRIEDPLILLEFSKNVNKDILFFELDIIGIFSKQKENCSIFYDNFNINESIFLKQHFKQIQIKGSIINKKILKKNNDYIVRLRIRISRDSLLAKREDLIQMFELTNYDLFWTLEKSFFNYHNYFRTFIVDTILDPKNERKKKLIIEGENPDFGNMDILKFYSFEEIVESYKVFNLNPDQQNAIKKSLMAKDYNLILGMPGTGKTHTIAILINILLDLGYKILITTYTNSALDNLLIKILELFPDKEKLSVRISNSQKYMIDPLIKRIFYDRNKINDTSEMKKFFENKKLFGVTNLSSTQALISKLNFDYAIIDEASQTIEPLLLGPISLAEKFILIGDYFQLQPLIKCKEAFEKGMKISLFERLCKENFENVCRLRYQYRMNDDIMCLSNALIYKNSLISANKEVGESKLNLNIERIQGIKWLHDVLNPLNRVVFLNVDKLENIPYKDDYYEYLKEITNANELDLSSSSNQKEQQSYNFQEKKSKYALSKIEKNLIYCIIKNLIDCGIQSSQIVLLTVYNIIKNKFEVKLKNLKVNVMTVDKSQGLDADCILIYSSKKMGKRNLMNDWRRVNVALTRAKKKLIFIGSLETLTKIDLLQKFINLISEKKWIYDLDESILHTLKNASQL